MVKVKIWNVEMVCDEMMGPLKDKYHFKY